MLIFTTHFSHNAQVSDHIASHWSSEGYSLYTYVTFTYHLSSCSSMVRASHWSSEGYRLYTLTFIHHLSPCSSMVRASHRSPGYINFVLACLSISQTSIWPLHELFPFVSLSPWSLTKPLSGLKYKPSISPFNSPPLSKSLLNKFLYFDLSSFCQHIWRC